MGAQRSTKHRDTRLPIIQCDGGACATVAWPRVGYDFIAYLSRRSPNSIRTDEAVDVSCKEFWYCLTCVWFYFMAFTSIKNRIIVTVGCCVVSDCYCMDVRHCPYMVCNRQGDPPFC